MLKKFTFIISILSCSILVNTNISLESNNESNIYINGIKIEFQNNFTKIDLSKRKIISNIEILANFTDLIDINLNSNQIEDIGPLSRLINLKYLHVSFNKIHNIKYI